MTRTPAPCWRCDEPGVRDVGTRGYCREHYIEIDPLEQPAMCVINGTLRTDNECTPPRGLLASSPLTGCSTREPLEEAPVSTNDATTVVNADPTSVYRYFDAHGTLIYVGVTRRGMARQAEHISKEWWPYVTTQDVQHYATRPEALAVERALIELHRPPFNVVHNQHHQAARATYIAAREIEDAAGALEQSPAYAARAMVLTLVDESDRLTYISGMRDVATSARIDAPVTLKRLTAYDGMKVGRDVKLSHRGPLVEASLITVGQFRSYTPPTITLRFTAARKKGGAISLVPVRLLCERPAA